METLPFNQLLYKKQEKFKRDIIKSYHMDMSFGGITNCIEKVHPNSDMTSSEFVLNQQAFSNCIKKFYNLIDKK